MPDSAIALKLNASERAAELFRFLNGLDDGVEVRPVACVQFGMEQFVIGANLECAAARGNQRKRFDALAELKNFGRQTDGLRRVVSNDAIFDRYLGFHRQNSFPKMKLSALRNEVKEREAQSSWLIVSYCVEVHA
jgi:hypothetical protein